MKSPHELTQDQRDAVDELVRQGYENSSQVAKLLGLTHEFVAEYMGGRQ